MANTATFICLKYYLITLNYKYVMTTSAKVRHKKNRPSEKHIKLALRRAGAGEKSLG